MNNFQSDPLLSTKAGHILSVLSEPGAFARRSPLDARQLGLFRKRRGLTLGAGQVSEADCIALVKAGLVAWTTIGKQKHLVICAAGLAACHRGADASRPQEADRANDTADAPARPAAVNLRESPLAWLHRRRTKSGARQISDVQFAAGERLRFDLERGQMLPRVTANWASPVSGTSASQGAPASASDSSLAARERVNAACRAVGPEFSGLLIDVCGFLKGLEQVESERDWPARSAKLLLRMGLDRLARHYGMTVPSGSGNEPSRLRIWQAGDARPTLLPAINPQRGQPAPGGHQP